MIKVRDFAPPAEELGLLGKSPVAGFERAGESANQWIEAFDINVVNIETVLLPNVESEQGTGEAELATSGATFWYQIVRVWYRDDEPDHEEEESKVFEEPSEVL